MRLGLSVTIDTEGRRPRQWATGTAEAAGVCEATLTNATYATDVSGCVGWFVANNYVAADGTWPDSSTAANHGTSAGGTTKPTAGTAIGSKATVTFDGADDAVLLPAALAANFSNDDAPITVVALLKTGTLAAKTLWSLSASGSANPVLRTEIKATTFEWETKRRDTTSTESVVDHTIATTGIESLISIDAAASHTMTVYVNGTKFASDPASYTDRATLGTLNQGAIGCFFRQASKTQFYAGDIAEIAFYTGTPPSEANLLAVSNGMRARAAQALN